MMTIKEFAALCNCNAQTLRYYDKIDLLKPVKVDPWSGYRYYTQSQAIDFVKIKNLQLADFTIEQIKKLLCLSDHQVYEAFSKKIAEQEQKLERIREIQQSYLTEINTMKILIDKLCDVLLEKAGNAESLREFGMVPEDIPELVAAVRRNIFERERQNQSSPESITIKFRDEVYTGEAAIENLITLLEEKNLSKVLGNMSPRENTEEPEEPFRVLWESHGWEHVYEFIDEIPALGPGVAYTLRLRIKQWDENISFPIFMIAAVMRKGYGPDIELGCSVASSDDGTNHVFLTCAQ